MSRKFVVILVAALALASVWLWARHDNATRASGNATTVDAAPATNAPESDRAAVDTPLQESPVPTGKPAFAPLPPEDAPLGDIFDELKDRASAGDAAAASRLYRDLTRCRILGGWQAFSLDRASEVLARNPDGASEETLGMVQAQIDYAQRLEQRCGKLEPRMLDDIVPAMLRAAQLGDADARDCYVHRGPAQDLTSLAHHPEFLDTYLRSAPMLVDAALAEGDWKMVDMLQYTYRVSHPGSLISGLFKPDPVQHYRYLKLFRLGADGDRVMELDAKLAAAAATLSPADIAQADAWAQDRYEQSFHGSSTDAVPPDWNACLPTH